MLVLESDLILARMASAVLCEESEQFDLAQEWARFCRRIGEVADSHASFFRVSGSTVVPVPANAGPMHQTLYAPMTQVLQNVRLVNAMDTSGCLQREKDFREFFDDFSLQLLLDDVSGGQIAAASVPAEFIVRSVRLFARALMDAFERKRKVLDGSDGEDVEQRDKEAVDVSDAIRSEMKTSRKGHSCDDRKDPGSLRDVSRQICTDGAGKVAAESQGSAFSTVHGNAEDPSASRMQGKGGARGGSEVAGGHGRGGGGEVASGVVLKPNRTASLVAEGGEKKRSRSAFEPGWGQGAGHPAADPISKHEEQTHVQLLADQFVECDAGGVTLKRGLGASSEIQKELVEGLGTCGKLCVNRRFQMDDRGWRSRIALLLFHIKTKGCLPRQREDVYCKLFFLGEP